MINSDTLKVLLIDPAFSTQGKGESQGDTLLNASVPLSVGLLGSYMKSKIPEIEVKILKASYNIIKYIDEEQPQILGICNYLWNTNLAVRLSQYAREKNPNIFIVFGGPEINKKPVDFKNFLKKYSHADMLVTHEGEIAFTQLVKTYLEENGDTKKIRSRINELGNCFYIENNEKFIAGPEIKRISKLNDIPSPYLMGLMDDFLSAGNYQPLVQTNRGCPYSCTFCQEGNSYYSRINYHSLDYVKKELDYIAERVNPEVGLFIVDSNFGMYKQDVEIAHHLAELKRKYKWPMFLHTSTGKSQLPRIKHVADILEGSLRISNAVQSLNNDVLDAIKRKNAATLEEFLKGLNMVSVPDIILPLPKETKETFIDGLNRLLDTKAPIRFTVFPALLLSDTEMNDNGSIGQHKLKVKFRQHQNLTGNIGGKLIFETERNIVQTSTMSEEDVFKARKYVVIMDALLREEPLKEIFYYLDSKNVSRSKLSMSMFNSLNENFTEIQECLNNYIKDYTSESFDTEEEVFEYMKKHSKDYEYGIKGGDLLRYSQKLWIDHNDAFFEWIFKNLNNIFKDDLEAKDEIKSLQQFLTFVYYERSKYHNKKISVSNEFAYDILKWMEEAPDKKLSEFKKNVKYSFIETNYSKKPNKDIWNSFGFNLDKDYTYAPSHMGRVYMSKTRRKIKREDGLEVKQKLPQMVAVAEKMSM
tara:strand:+ start:1669 stop:3765 length:2097 start_codon:yes stop_codon:yes gene_type:complete